MATDESLQGSKTLIIRRGLVESVDLYEIKDSELDTLEKGGSAGLQLNFAIFLLSMAFSAITSLFTATFSNGSIKTTFIVVAVVGILLGAYLMIAWSRSRSTVKQLCKTIRLRISLAETRANAPSEAEEAGAAMPETSAAAPVAPDETPQG